MEKTSHISIAGTQFLVTETAYQKLASYLESLKLHFQNEEDSDEIIRDIETRIAEKLLEKKRKLISTGDVLSIIEEIGDVSQFDTSSEKKDEPTKTASRKLYRNPDDAIIAGIASGIAAYFNIPPLAVRLIFFFSMFFGGTGIAVYLLLWLLIPSAESASQKLEMRGDPVTLDAISKFVKDRVAETKERGAFQKIIRFPFEVLGNFFRFLAQRILPIIGTLFGIVLSLVSSLAILGITLTLSIAATNWDRPFIDGSVRDIVSPLLFWSGAIAGYIAIIVPFIFLFFLGGRLIRNRNFLSPAIGFGLVGIWFLAVIASGVVGTRIAGNYYAYTLASPAHQETTNTVSVENFQEVSVKDARVIFRHGNAESVTVSGKQMAIDKVIVEVKDGVLTIEGKPWDDTCLIFCERPSPSVTIVTPDLEKVTVIEGNVSFEAFVTNTLNITDENSSVRGTITTDTLSFSSKGSNVRADIEAKKLIIDGKNSYFDLEGKASLAEITLHNADLSGESLELGSTTLSSDNSFARLWVVGKFQVTKDRSSSIQNEYQLETEAVE